MGDSYISPPCLKCGGYHDETDQLRKRLAEIKAENAELCRKLWESEAHCYDVESGEVYLRLKVQRDALAAALHENLAFQQQQLDSIEAAIVCEEWVGEIPLSKQVILRQAKSRLELWRAKTKTATAVLVGIPAPPTEVKNG